MVRIELELDKPEIPDWDFSGVHYPYDVCVRSWRAYRKHGVLFVAGGYLDQPPEWWDMIHTFEAIYRTRQHENMPAYEAMLESRAKKRGVK
jgi:hypothetical protein